MTSYLVTIETDHHTEVVPNDVLSCGENLRKTFKAGGGGGGLTTPLYIRGLIDLKLRQHLLSQCTESKKTYTTSS